MDTSLLLASRLRASRTGVERSEACSQVPLHADDSAFYALTDFRREDPITVCAGSDVEDAQSIMHRLGVHALVVTEPAPNGFDPQVVGLITAFDIDRERARRATASDSDHTDRPIRVEDVMTAWNELPLVHYESLETLNAKETYDMFLGTGLTHLLVIEMQADDSAVACGILSRAALARRLGRGTHG